MKVLQVSPTWWPATRYGGTIVSVRALASTLVAQDVSVSVATTNVDGPGDAAVPLDRPWMDQGVEINSFPSKFGRRTYWSPPMRRYLQQRTGEFDLVHTHSVFLWPTWQAARCARAAQRPLVLTPRGMLVPELIRARSTWPKRIWLRWFERSNLRGAAAIHVTSALERDDLLRMELGPLPRIVLIPNGVDMPAASTAARKTNQLLFVGRLCWIKGLTELLDAVARFPDLRLLVAGPDDEGLLPKLRARAQSLGIAERVSWLGAITPLERDRLLAESTMLLLPSLSENFGNSAAEAMAAACPVVVSSGAGIAEHVRAADCGIVVSPHASDIAAAISKLIAQPIEAAAMGERGRNYVKRHLAWAAVASEMKSLYQELLAR